MSSYERAVEYAEYLVALARDNPAALQTSSTSSSSKVKSIHQKLVDLHVEETAKQPEESNLLCNTHLLSKLVRRDKLNCLILNLYPGNDGYSLMLKSKTGVETETFKLPYEVTELLDYVDDSELPPFLVDLLEKAQVNVFYNGCVIVEVRDFRRSTSGGCDTQYVLLKPTPQSLLCDINNLTNDGHVWTQEDLFHLEGKLLLATEEPLCLDPSPAVMLVANRQQYHRKKLNNPGLKRAVKKFTQAAVNRKRKFAQSATPSELKLHDFIVKRKEKKTSTPNLKLSGKLSVDSWKQKPVTLATPESVDVEKFAKVIEKPEKTVIKENSLTLVEEHVLERDVTQEKKLLAKLTIFHRPVDDAYLGELYLDHDYVEDKSKGAICNFLLGNKDSVKKYLDQFREIFTEEGRRAVKITTQRPGQLPIVTCTQTTPTGTMQRPGQLPIVTCTQTTPSGVGHVMAVANPGAGKAMPSTSILQSVEASAVPSMPVGGVGGLKRAMPIQLSLSIGPTGVSQTAQGQISQQQQALSGHTANQVQLSIQPQSVGQSQLQTQRLQQAVSQSQSASQRLKQLGIHTNIGSRNNTPTASPVSCQPSIAQLFGSPTSVGNSPLLSTKIPTPTPTPPPIVSPPPVPAAVTRKPSLPSESSTVHHMAQTPHQANVNTYIQGESTSQVSNVSHQPAGITNISIANIASIPPNVNIQNLSGLPGMNIANLQSLQNMQVSLSVPGGSIAVPISMISTNPLLQSHQSSIVTSASGTPPHTQTVTTTAMSASAQSSMVTMVTQLPPSLTTSTSATSHIVTGVLSSPSNVISTPAGMLSLPIGNITQIVPAGIKSHGQLRSSTSLPVLQLVNLPQQRNTLKPSATLQPGQTLGVKPTTSITGPLTTTILPNPSMGPGQQQVLSQLSVGKPGQQAGITTTLTHQQFLQLPQFQAQLQAFQKPQQHPQQQQQQLQFHQILQKQPSIPPQSGIAFGAKPKNKKRTTPTPPK